MTQTNDRVVAGRAGTAGRPPSGLVKGAGAVPNFAAPAVPRGPVRWAFLLFVFSIPLEYPGRTTLPEVHTVTGAAAVALTLLYKPSWFATVPRAVWPFALFIWVFLARTLFTEHQNEAVRTMLQYCLAGAVFWISIRFLSHRDLAWRALVAFAAGCTVIVLLERLGIATTIEEGRQVVFGQDANMLGGNMALGLVAVLSLYFERVNRLAAKAMALGIAVLLGTALIESGSRGAILGAAGGLIGLMLQAGDDRKPIRRAAILGMIAVIGTVALFSSEMMRNRFANAVEGNLAKRERLFPAAWAMFEQRPVVGWGPADATYALAIAAGEYGMGRRVADQRVTPHRRDFHNLPLELLATFGVAGAAPMFVCIGMCGVSAWFGRRRQGGAGPLALMIVMLMLSFSANKLLAKQTWVIFAYAYVSGYAHWVNRAAPSRRRRNAGAGLAPGCVVRLPGGGARLESNRTRRAVR